MVLYGNSTIPSTSPAATASAETWTCSPRHDESGLETLTSTQQITLGRLIQLIIFTRSVSPTSIFYLLPND